MTIKKKSKHDCNQVTEQAELTSCTWVTCHLYVITGASYRDDGTTLIHGKDLEDVSTEPTVRGDSTSSLPHLSLTKLSDGAQGKVVLSSSIDPERTLNREGESDRCTL